MATFDVRDNPATTVDKIVFADRSDYRYTIATQLEFDGDDDIIVTSSGNDDYVRIHSIAHAQNLIKALNKAIELGWLKD